MKATTYPTLLRRGAVTVTAVAALCTTAEAHARASAEAQDVTDEPDVPKGTVAPSTASSGTTELDGQGTFAAAAAPIDAKPDDATELDISAGGLLSRGNAEALSVTGASNFRLRRGLHQLGAAAAGNYGRAVLDEAQGAQDTVGNIQGRVRYDAFAHSRVSFFAMATGRHDPFQGLDLRLNIDPGVAFYYVATPKQRLWNEVGYDFQYDVRTDDVIRQKDDEGNVELDDTGNPIIIADKKRKNHAVRLFGGYTNNVNSQVSFSTGLEYLQSVLEAKRWRLNWDVALTANLVNNLAVSTTLTTRIDNDPAPDVKAVDVITSFSFVYRFF